jgi:hypothetical protein
MKKSELIAKLQEIPEDFDVLFGTPDDWFYDVDITDIKKIKDGREDSNGERVITIT